MRKIFFLTALLMMILTATAFAEEVAEPAADEQPQDEPYIYTSEDFQYSIACPIKPLAVVQNPWQEPEKRGEMLVFANDGWTVQYAYLIQVNAFDSDKIPDFNKADKKTLDEYLEALKKTNGFGQAELVGITKDNKGIYAVTAETIEVLNKETGEVEGEFVADRQDVYTFFRTPAGRCVSIQLLTLDMDKVFVDTYRYGVASFKDNSVADKKSKDKKSKDKKSKDKKDKDKKSKDKDKKSKDEK